MQLFIMVFSLVLVSMGILASHHAQVTEDRVAQSTVAELGVVFQALTPAGEASSSSSSSAALSSTQIVGGLAVGCLFLIACCTIGLALIAARVWHGKLPRTPNAIPLRRDTRILGWTPAGPSTAARPSLVALSISRT